MPRTARRPCKLNVMFILLSEVCFIILFIKTVMPVYLDKTDVRIAEIPVLVIGISKSCYVSSLIKFYVSYAQCRTKGKSTGVLAPGAKFYEATFSGTKIRLFLSFFPRFNVILQSSTNC